MSPSAARWSSSTRTRPRTAAGTTASTSASRRAARGASMYGGVTAGRQITVFCEVDDPNSLRFCDQRDLDLPYLYQFKLAGTYPLPYGVHLSGSWQGLPGVPVGTARQDAEYVAAQNRVPDASLNVEYNVTRTQIPALTVTSITVPLITPGKQFLDRRNQIDVRLSKKVRVSERRSVRAVRHLQPAQRQHDPQPDRDNSDRRWAVRRRFCRAACSRWVCSWASRTVNSCQLPVDKKGRPAMRDRPFFRGTVNWKLETVNCLYGMPRMVARPPLACWR